MQGHYVRPAETVTAPRNLVSVYMTVRCDTDRETPGAEPVVFQRAYTAASIWRRTHWQETILKEHRTGYALHDYLEEWAADKRATFVVSPNASQVLTLTKFWKRITEHGSTYVAKPGHYGPQLPSERDPNTYYVRRDVMRGKPDIVSYQIDKKSLTWVSGRQYFTADDIELAKSIGFEWSFPRGQTGKAIATTHSPWEYARLWLELFKGLGSWWREVGGGPWGYTAGHLGMQFFRKRLVERAICTHKDPIAHAMEGRAIFAGRASTFYTGDVGSPKERRASEHPAPPRSPRGWIPGPLWSIDVRSMYPWLLASQLFPVRKVGLQGETPLKDVIELSEGFGLIADVWMSSDHAEFPHRRNGRIVYPLGKFRTTLCGPELVMAIQQGDVARVEQVALYQLGYPFRQMANDLIHQRLEARRTREPAWELFVKLLSNAFTGKLAQKGARYEHRPEIAAEVDWGEFGGVSASTGKRTRYRSRNGMVAEYVVDESFGRPMGFAYAYLTSYARLHMRKLREAAPPDTIISQDTDGLWCLKTGADAILRGFGGERDTAGGLKIDEIQTAGRWFGPKHYWLPRGWTLSGFHQPARIGDGLEFLDTFIMNPIHQACHDIPTKVIHCVRRGTLDVQLADGTADKFGWMRPLKLTA